MTQKAKDPDGKEAERGTKAAKDAKGPKPEKAAGPETDAGEQAEALESAPAEESADVKFVRLAADFQNYKQRTERERFERYTEGKKDFAADLLAVLDNFDRALAEEMPKMTDSQFYEGMGMVRAQLMDVLAKNGVKEIEALGQPFDPNLHHAVIMEPSSEYDCGKVSEVLQKGYALGEKVIRTAMVKVAE
ncbi:MAG: nucleotide exchange factor GrpE [Clostridiales bacterium]|nr:nucleotide exchange factor GrpE [Clostridiales bacterium]